MEPIAVLPTRVSVAPEQLATAKAALADVRVGLGGFRAPQLGALRDLLDWAGALCRAIPDGDLTRLATDPARVDLTIIAADGDTIPAGVVDALLALDRPMVFVAAPDTLAALHRRRLPRHELQTQPWSIPEMTMRMAATLLSANAAPATVHDAAGSPTAPPVLMIADDDPLLTQILTATLTQQGFTCHVARDGDTAIDLASRIRPDLVLLDVNMPNRDGFAVLAALRRRIETRHVKVLMLTASAGERDIMRAVELRVDGYLRKPFEADRVGERIRTLLRAAASQARG